MFAKMKPICELEERHGVDLGVGYKNSHACVTFVSFIAKKKEKKKEKLFTQFPVKDQLLFF